MGTARRTCDDVAQLVEQVAVNHRVVGSSPSVVAIGAWCNWQHIGFWHRRSRFESLRPNHSGLSVLLLGWEAFLS